MGEAVTTSMALNWVGAALGFIIAFVLAIIAKNMNKLAKDVGDIKVSLGRHEAQADSQHNSIEVLQDEVKKVRSDVTELKVKVAEGLSSNRN